MINRPTKLQRALQDELQKKMETGVAKHYVPEENTYMFSNIFG